jgi:hypothetical protein
MCLSLIEKRVTLHLGKFCLLMMGIDNRNILET